MRKTIIAYYRVSTKRQGRSGLGLDAQRQELERYAVAIGGRIVAEFIETESGKKSARPQLQAALARTRAKRGVLVIAKLDRLSRNVAFVSALMESGVDFVACDMPDANRLTIHIMAAMAEHEAKAISTRTTAALAVAKRRGKLLGTHRPGHVINHRKGTRNGQAKAVAAAAAMREQARQDCYGEFVGDVQAWRADGLGYAAIADRLNEAGHATTSGGKFYAMTVQRMLAG